jgi:hypothetical protein
MTLHSSRDSVRAWQDRGRKPLGRSKPLLPGGTGLKRVSLTVVRDIGSGQSAPKPRTPIKPVSAKRARQNRERAAMADRRWPDRREGTVMCSVPGCTRPADDLHETLTRARGGDITDERVTEPVCRQHNDDMANRPESELGWAYSAGLLRHSWDGPPPGDAA